MKGETIKPAFVMDICYHTVNGLSRNYYVGPAKINAICVRFSCKKHPGKCDKNCQIVRFGGQNLHFAVFCAIIANCIDKKRVRVPQKGVRRKAVKRMFYLFFLVCSVAFSTWTVFAADISLWWQPLLAALYLYGSFLLHVGVFCVVALLMKNSKKETPKSWFWRFYFRETFHFILRMLRVRVHGEKLENLPKKGARYLLVCNHLSHFDPMVACTYIRRHRLVFISKPENFKIFAIGPYMRRLNFIPIDRISPKSAMMAIRSATKHMTESEGAVGVYPEGTISRDGVFAGFHEGVFLAAKKAGVPVVVSTIWGTQFVKKRFWHLGTDIRFRFEGIISAEEVATLRTNELSDKARDMMRPTLAAYGMQTPANEEATAPDLAAIGAHAQSAKEST